ncbi:type VI secretion protein [Caballeronia mineralivorans PML1(12)]|uniref:Type VI secretion protein n=1 Tax=Caballeronia mineralivorans PML1(12) TaxID=908627 RepID=A0A0J1CLQ9_9BURK|nr:Hcp family type VI secretion system effector [Caballeronia mineralivorans]KLU21464.1 type VI secretion protein [Caballeronia mineralivorans PML1(12)]
MPMPCYLSVTDATGKAIEGSCNVQGHQGKILVQAVEHRIEMPRDPQTGLPSGKRQHMGLEITKVVDKSSPKLLQALCRGERIKEATLEFYRINEKGQEEKYYTVQLEKASIVSTRLWVPNCLEPENKPLTHMENFSFTYEKVIWTSVLDSIQSEDSWLAPNT